MGPPGSPWVVCALRWEREREVEEKEREGLFKVAKRLGGFDKTKIHRQVCLYVRIINRSKPGQNVEEMLLPVRSTLLNGSASSPASPEEIQNAGCNSVGY